MTEKTTTRTFTVLHDGLTLPFVPPLRPGQHERPDRSRAASFVAKRGDEWHVTPAVVESTRDRFGHSWVEDLTGEAQISNWGKVMLLEGERPDWLTTELESAADAKAKADRLERAKEARRYGRQLAPTEDEILAAADNIRARLNAGIR